MNRILPSWLALSSAVLLPCVCRAADPIPDAATPAFDIRKIHHVVVIYQENWSFDGLYARFPGADGYAYGSAVRQTDINGNVLKALPLPLQTDLLPAYYYLDPNFRTPPPQALYDLSTFVRPTTMTGDLVHRFYTEQLQINHGALDRYVAWSDNPGLVTGAFDATCLPEGRLASQYVMCDHFFHSAFGGSFLNHQFFVAAQAPVWPKPFTALPTSGFPKRAGAPFFIKDDDVEAPKGSKLLPLPKPSLPVSAFSFPGGNNWPAPLTAGNQKFDRDLTVCPDENGDYFAVNTVQPSSWPFDPVGPFLPLLKIPTIGDRLSDAKVTWKWYSGGWDQAVAGNPDPKFQFHHQPFNYYANYAPGTVGRHHLVDLNELAVDLAGQNLPAVSFVKFQGELNEHPGYSEVASGQQATADLVALIQRSYAWDSTLIIITYDENGGRWDHVPPPEIDKWGPGTRVPTILVSPFVRRHFVDHTQYETVSILRFIEDRWHLKPLGTRDSRANSFTASFDPAK